MRKRRRRSSGSWLAALMLLVGIGFLSDAMGPAAALVALGIFLAAGVGIGFFLANRKKKAAAEEAAKEAEKEAEAGDDARQFFADTAYFL